MRCQKCVISRTTKTNHTGCAVRSGFCILRPDRLCRLSLSKMHPRKQGDFYNRSN
jgi:hypothetical protein